MPAEGLPWMPRAEQLTDAELVRLITIAESTVDIAHEALVRLLCGQPEQAEDQILGHDVLPAPGSPVSSRRRGRSAV